MKMTREHYEHIERHVAPHAARVPYSEYAKRGLSALRYRWDLLYAANLIPWVCHELYSYLHDDHIDTALRRITGTK